VHDLLIIKITRIFERLIENPRVPGSIPGPATIFCLWQHQVP